MSTLINSHIEMREGPRGPRPRVVGKGVLVQAIVAWNIILKMSPEEIAASHDLSLAEVHSALAYYYDHREQIDLLQQEDEEYVEQMKKANPSLLQEKLKKRFGN
jgi:uncharacterized protein (DUF433 family)